MMDMNGSNRDRWTCPNDRQLALRAKLKTGWSVKTQTMQSFNARSEALDERERQIILEVIKRAETLEFTEQQRVGKLVQKLECMKKNAMGNGTNKCLLCGDSFGILGASGSVCKDCKKVACQKCGIEATATHPNGGSSSKHPETIWLCKICAETREMWKKSGAWFFKGIPKYVLPEKGPNIGIGRGRPSIGNIQSRIPARNTPASAPLGRRVSEVDEESSSEDDQLGRRARLQHSNASTVSHSIGSIDSGIVGGNTTQTQQRSLDAESDKSSNSGGSLRGLLRREASVDAAGSEAGSLPSRDSRDSRDHGVHWADCDSVTDGVNGQVFVPSQAFTSCSVRRDSTISGASSTWCNTTADERSSITSLSARSIGGASVAGSENGDDDIPEEAYLGSMEYSVTYDPQTSTLHCCLHRAKGLRPMDINGLCDPYCRAQLLPAVGNKSCTPLRTKTVHKTRDPEFNESLAWCHVTETDHARKTLHLVLFDEDKCGHEALGSSRLHLSRLSPGQTSHFNVFLEKPYPDEVSEEETGPGRGRILVSLCYSSRRRALVIGVIRCAGLASMDSNGTSDPFVKLQLKNDPQRRKFKTAIKWRNLNPEFNEEFTFEVKMVDLSRRSLLISVWDKDLGKANDYLGGLELGLCSKGERLKHWLDVIKFADRRHERWHNLTALPVTE